MDKKAVVLLSGGIDSTTCLALAVKEYGAENVLALSLYYGQKHQRELDACDNVAQYYGVTHITRELSEVFKFSDCPLLEGRGEIKHESYADQLAAMGTVDTYVPFRNGLFLAYATTIAISVHAEVVYYGAHADDAAGRAYPDCTPEFIDAQAKAIYEGTGKKVCLQAPWWNMNKAAIVAEGIAVGMTHEEFEHTWSCYEGQEEPCGSCGTCIDRKAAFEANGIMDIM